MIRLLVPLLFAFAMAAPAIAAEASPVKVTADSFVVEDAKQLATFTGNVVVVRKNLDLWADKLVVEYGEGGQSDIKSFTATGHVRIKTEGQDATGNRATFNPATQILRLIDDVTVTNASGTVKGPELIINLVDNTTQFKGNDGGRVTGVFTPQ